MKRVLPQWVTSPRGLLWLALSLGLLIAVFVQRRVFWDAFAINDDVRNQAYWMARIVDPDLYPDDLIASYFTQPSLISPVVRSLYTFAAQWIDPIRFSQFLPFALIVLSTWFLFKFAEIRANAWYALGVCWLFNLSAWTVRNFAGGLPRAFSYPILFLFLWQYETRNVLGLSLALCLGVLIYPPVALLCVGMLVWDAMRGKRGDAQPLGARIWIGVVVALLLGALRYVGPFSSNAFSSQRFGALVNLEGALKIQEFFPGGRVPLFPFPDLSAVLPWSALQLPLQLIPHLYITLPMLGLIIIWLGYRKTLQRKMGALPVPGTVLGLMGVSVLLYLLAWCLLFSLYVPERYLQFTLPVLIVFVLAGFLYNLSRLWKTHSQRIVALWLLPLLIVGPLWQTDLVNPSPDSRALMGFLSRLPENAMIAANPGVSSHIPAFSRRSVFVSHEGYIPFHPRYFKTLKTRLKDWLQAYYSTEPAALRKLLYRYPIHYLVVDTNDYETERLKELEKNYYHAFEPAFFQKLNQGAQKSRYLLYRLTRQYAIYRNDTYYVVPTEAIKKALSGL